MRIALLNLTGGGIGSGYRKYLLNMVPRLASHPAVDSVLCASPYGLNVQDWFENISKVDFIGCRPFRFMHHRPDSELYDNLKKYRPDVIFIPLERYLKFENIPVVTMVRNMEPLLSPEMPNQLRERVRIWAQTWEAGTAVRRSSRIIAVSQFVKDFILRRWNISQNKVSLIYFGSEHVTEGKGSRPNTIPEAWTNDFVFTAGSIEPYRGIEDIVEALSYLRGKNRRIRLVIGGQERPQMQLYKGSIERMAEEHGVAQNIVWVGNLNIDEMLWCYRNCKVFVMSSRVEACPNTAMEAMAYGCISAVADNPPLPEFFRECAAYYPPKDGKALGETILRLLGQDERERMAVSEMAMARARAFSWDDTVAGTIQALRDAVMQGGRKDLHCILDEDSIKNAVQKDRYENIVDRTSL